MSRLPMTRAKRKDTANNLLWHTNKKSRNPLQDYGFFVPEAEGRSPFSYPLRQQQLDKHDDQPFKKADDRLQDTQIKQRDDDEQSVTFKTMRGFLDTRGCKAPGVQKTLYSLERYGLLIIIALLYLGVLDPIIRSFEWLIMSVIKVLL